MRSHWVTRIENLENRLQEVLGAIQNVGGMWKCHGCGKSFFWSVEEPAKIKRHPSYDMIENPVGAPPIEYVCKNCVNPKNPYLKSYGWADYKGE